MKMYFLKEKIILILVNMLISFQSTGQEKMSRTAFLSMKMGMDQYSSIVGRIVINFKGPKRIFVKPL